VRATKKKRGAVKQIDSDKYNVAWFKLAECVSRHEKERALGVLHLLVHSLDDVALGYKLEGDVYVSFNEIENAITRYTLAAKEYQREKRFFEAAGIYGNLIALKPKSKEYALALVRLYKVLNVHAKQVESLTTLFDLWIDEQLYLRARDTLKELIFLDPSYKIFSLTQAFIFDALDKKYFEFRELKDLLKRYIDSLVMSDNSTEVTQFLSVLEAKSSALYGFACNCLDENKK
jgi:tetratricopeptide (TPR) repeat protein